VEFSSILATCRIAVGSTRRPKLEAVREAAAAFSQVLRADAILEVFGREVESGVSHTPTSREELMRGARQRAEALLASLKATNESADFFVGLEGGLDVAYENDVRRVYLQSWAYVTDGRRGYFGCSGAIELPDALADEVLLHGTELAVAVDQFAGQVGIRDAQGAWGVLSLNLIARAESFRLATTIAFAPFYNAAAYNRGEDRGSAAAAG
jgi:inosine/xanthosine triphosphatase